MPIYDKPVRVLIRDMISKLAPGAGQYFTKDDAMEWFAKNYPKIKEGTVAAHLLRFSTNVPSLGEIGQVLQSNFIMPSSLVVLPHRQQFAEHPQPVA